MSFRFAFRAALLCFTLASPLSLSTQGYAQHADTSLALTAEERRVLATEDEYVEAEINRDEATLRRLVDDRFVHNLRNGTTAGKEELIEGVMKMSMTGQTISERSVIVEGDIALVFGTAELRFGGPDDEESTTTLRYTSTFVKRKGQWRMLALQMQKRAPD